MLLSIAVLKGFKGEVTAKQRGFFGDVTLTKYDLNSSYEPSPFRLSEAEIESLRSIPGDESMQYYGPKAGNIKVNNEVEGVLFKGIDSAYNQRFIVSTLSDGLPINFADSARAVGQILISNYTARRLQLAVGDDFIIYFVQERMRPRKFNIVGIYHT